MQFNLVSPGESHCLYRRLHPDGLQLAVEPAAAIDEHQRPHLLMRQVDDVAVSGCIGAVALDDSRRHEFVDDGPKLLRYVLQLFVSNHFFVLAFFRVIGRPYGPPDNIVIAWPLLHLPAVGVISGSGVALNGNDTGRRDVLDDPSVVRGRAARKVIDRYVSGPVVPSYPASRSLCCPHHSPAGSRGSVRQQRRR